MPNSSATVQSGVFVQATSKIRIPTAKPTMKPSVPPITLFTAREYGRTAASASAATLGPVLTKDDVFEALRHVEDPELGMDIVDLGLVYDVDVEGEKVTVTHSLTSMGCPAGPMIQDDIYRAISELGASEVEVELTWDPPWTPERMSDDAKFILGFG
jgi:metal-sulfur cluster biosynthetic enzyme